MKKIIISILILFCAGIARSQTVIPATTTIDSLNKMPKGSYRFYTIAKKDTVNMSKDTIPKCPVVVCPVCPTCPTCPAIPPERIVIGITMDSTKTFHFTYNRGPQTTL